MQYQPPNPITHTPKQYAEAWLRWVAQEHGTTISSVRSLYSDEAGMREIEQNWVNGVVNAAVVGKQILSQLTLDKLLEIRPDARLPESAIPHGYQRPEARAAEKSEKLARKASA